MNRSTSIGRLGRRAPELAKLRIMRALAAAEGNVSGASRIVGLDRDRLIILIAKYDLGAHLREVRALHGWSIGLPGGQQRLTRR